MEGSGRIQNTLSSLRLLAVLGFTQQSGAARKRYDKCISQHNR
jgi:hypothetical protein